MPCMSAVGSGMHASLKPPDISITDDQGNLQSHSEFLPFQYRPPPYVPTHEDHSLHHRSRTFTTINDALEHNARLYTTQEVNNVNSTLPANGFLANMSLRKSYEDILVKRMDHRDSDDIVNRLIEVLDSRHIEYKFSRSGSIHLNHSQGQVKMEVVQSTAGNNFNDLRFRHMSGDSNHNRQLCHDLMEYLCN